MYKNLFKLSKEMDEEFSYKNLIVVSAALINSTILIFFMLICAYRIAQNAEAMSGIEFVTALRGASVHLSMIWGLVWSCETTCNEVALIFCIWNFVFKWIVSGSLLHQ